MSSFNNNNWNHSQYQSEHNKAIISIGAHENKPEEICYYITVLDEENNELFQQEFKELDQACQEINSRYQDIWDYNDLSQEKKKTGCDSCSAH